MDAVGCHVERQRGRSSGTDRDRQWRFGGGGGGGGELCRAAKETSGLWSGSPEWERGHSASGPQEASKLLALDAGRVVQLGSEDGKTDMVQNVQQSRGKCQPRSSGICIECVQAYLVSLDMRSTRRWDSSPQQVGTEKERHQVLLTNEYSTEWTVKSLFGDGAQLTTVTSIEKALQYGSSKLCLRSCSVIRVTIIVPSTKGGAWGRRGMTQGSLTVICGNGGGGVVYGVSPPSPPNTQTCQTESLSKYSVIFFLLWMPPRGTKK